MFDFISSLSESKTFPSKESVEKHKAIELAEIAYLLILALRVLLWDDSYKNWAQTYCDKTTSTPNFKKWRTDSTDLYVAMFGLTKDKEAHEFGANQIWNWLHKAGNGYLSEKESRKLFAKLDSYFHIRNESMCAVRRLVMDFPEIKRSEEKLAITRLLQLLRHRASKSEVYKQLHNMASFHNYEIQNANDPEEHKKKTTENASVGATSSASIATVVGGLGAGFDDDLTKSIYGKQKKPLILKRNLTEEKIVRYKKKNNFTLNEVEEDDGLFTKTNYIIKNGDKKLFSTRNNFYAEFVFHELLDGKNLNDISKNVPNNKEIGWENDIPWENKVKK